MTYSRSRGYRKSLESRLWLAEQLQNHHHAHVVTPGQLWCVTSTGIGTLWEKLPPPSRGPAAGRSIYDELNRPAQE